jgi:hypothetical protein
LLHLIVTYNSQKPPKHCKINCLPGVAEESSADEEDADQHPSCHSCHALGVGAVGGDRVENVDQHLKSLQKRITINFCSSLLLKKYRLKVKWNSMWK